MLIPQIIEKPVLTVVGLETAFIHALSPQSTGAAVIPLLWDKFGHRAAEVAGRIDQAMYGVIYGKPEAERSHHDELQYIAAVAVNAPAAPPEGMVCHTVPAATFAVFLHRGPITNIAQTCQEIYCVWLAQSAWQHAGIADVEVYDHRFNCESAASEMEYWISVRPKG